ncbi:EamA family transporter RarD [Oligella sp. MSHR50489EDL]|uniref:EamA family transporter RarD n=1 Tax=Oligella sp. MSHR50489EDL TaxID=3139409 RepID=UPI003D81AFE2
MSKASFAQPPSDPLTQRRETRCGVLYALMCYCTWGLFPIYWSLLSNQGLSAAQLMGHRVLWTSVVAVLLLFISKQQKDLVALFKQPKMVAFIFLASMALGLNWLSYIYGVSINRVIEASLGYFMSPLMSIALARIFIGERINRAQSFAVVLASAGVLWLSILAGNIPWIALIISGSWSLYSLLRKQAVLPLIPGFAIETLFLLPFALSYLIYLNSIGEFHFLDLPINIILLIIGTGFITGFPLLFFGAAAKRIRLNTLGILLYINPTMQFLIGLLIFKEPFDGMRFVAYVLVWIAVIIFTGSSYRAYKKATARATH